MAVPPREFDIPSNVTHADFRAWESNQVGAGELFGDRERYPRRRLPWKILIGFVLVAIALFLLLAL